MSNHIDELQRLSKLRDEGILTPDEFEVQKKQILKALSNSRQERQNSTSDKTIATNNKAILSGQTTIQAPESSLPGQTTVGPTNALIAGKTIVQQNEYGQLGQKTHITTERPQQKKEHEPAKLGNYRLLERIGEGGMGSVYRGRHELEEYAKQAGDVAIKLMHEKYAKEEGFRSRFIQEAALGRQIKHDGIAQVLDVVVDGQHLALVMELIEGEELNAIMTNEGMELEKCLSILQPIAEALDYLHTQNIIHRDMKPSNVRFHMNGNPVILDFGIAKDDRKDEGMTRTGVAMGTIAYMAPEQMNAKNVTGAADQYALAMMTYQMLAGYFPWKEETTEFGIVDCKLNNKLLPIGAHRKDIPTSVEKAIERGLLLDPLQRFPSCCAFVDSLRELNVPQEENEVFVQTSSIQDQDKAKPSPVDTTNDVTTKTRQLSRTSVPPKVQKQNPPPRTAPLDGEPPRTIGLSSVSWLIIGVAITLFFLGFLVMQQDNPRSPNEDSQTRKMLKELNHKLQDIENGTTENTELNNALHTFRAQHPSWATAPTGPLLQEICKHRSAPKAISSLRKAYGPHYNQICTLVKYESTRKLTLPSFKASYCDRPSRKGNSKLICDNRFLRELDAILGLLHRERKNYADVESYNLGRKTWIKARKRKCGSGEDVQCLYTETLVWIRDILGQMN